jgi:hypothetical protein
MLMWAGRLQTVYFDQKKRYWWKIDKNYEMKNDALRRRYFRLNCRQVIWMIVSNIQQYKWRCTSTWRQLDEIKHWCAGGGSTFSSESHRKHSQTFWASCYCSLFVRNILLERFDASFIESKPLIKLWNLRGSLLRLPLGPALPCGTNGSRWRKSGDYWIQS